jgi:hypothetical protein
LYVVRYAERMLASLSEDKIRGIVAELAQLRADHGDAFASPALVEPNGEYFPDHFALDPDGIDALVRRMLTYAPLSGDLDVQLGFIEPDGEAEAAGGGCSSGGCSTPSRGGAGGAKATSGAIETPDGYAVLLHVQDVGDPTVLTTCVARSLGRIVLFETDCDVDVREEGPRAELAAIACGFGLLLLNGACVYKKGCGGMRRHQATFLDLDEIALGLALFVRTTNAKPGAVRRHLEVTQRESFDLALDWVDGQPSLVRTLTERPETLADGIFELEKKKGLFSRLFSRKPADDEPTPSARRTERSVEEERRLAEARALVEEALSDP